MRTLKLRFDPVSFIRTSEAGEGEPSRDLAAAREVAANYKLTQLSSMISLVRIELEWHRPWRSLDDYEYHGWSTWFVEHGHGGGFASRMAELETWLIDEFAVTGRSVLVDIVPV